MCTWWCVVQAKIGLLRFPAGCGMDESSRLKCLTGLMMMTTYGHLEHVAHSVCIFQLKSTNCRKCDRLHNKNMNKKWNSRRHFISFWPFNTQKKRMGWDC